MKHLLMLLILIAIPFSSAEYLFWDCYDIEKLGTFNLNDRQIPDFDKVFGQYSLVFGFDDGDRMYLEEGSRTFPKTKEGDIIKFDGVEFEFTELNNVEEYFVITFNGESHVVPFYNYNYEDNDYKTKTLDYAFFLWFTGEEGDTLWINKLHKKERTEFYLGEEGEFNGVKFKAVELRKGYSGDFVTLVKGDEPLNDFCYSKCDETRCFSEKQDRAGQEIIPSGIVRLRDNDVLKCDNATITFGSGPGLFEDEKVWNLNLVSNMSGKFEGIYYSRFLNQEEFVDPIDRFTRRIGLAKEGHFMCNGKNIEVIDYHFSEGWIDVKIAEPLQPVEEIKEPEPICITENETKKPLSECCDNLSEIKDFAILNDKCIEQEATYCSSCGNNICDGKENYCNCPADCEQPEKIVELPEKVPIKANTEVVKKTFFQKITDFFKNLF